MQDSEDRKNMHDSEDRKKPRNRAGGMKKWDVTKSTDISVYNQNNSTININGLASAEKELSDSSDSAKQICADTLVQMFNQAKNSRELWSTYLWYDEQTNTGIIQLFR